jgi:hypothetical protein
MSSRGTLDPQRHGLAVATAVALGLVLAGVLLRARWLFSVAYTLAALGIAATGGRWIVTGRAETKYWPVQHGWRARLMGAAVVGAAALLGVGALGAWPAAW